MTKEEIDEIDCLLRILHTIKDCGMSLNTDRFTKRINYLVEQYPTEKVEDEEK